MQQQNDKLIFYLFITESKFNLISLVIAVHKLKIARYKIKLDNKQEFFMRI